MNKFSEQDLFMVYLNACDNKDLEQEILSSPEACKKLAQLEKEMNTLENSIDDHYAMIHTQISHNPKEDDYGHQLWNNIVNKLEDSPKPSKVTRLLKLFTLPKVSLAGLAAVFIASVTFYMIGSIQSQKDAQVAHISAQLLAQNIQSHLAQSDIFLTQVSNMPEMSHTPMMISTAKHLLSSNRIFKNAIKSAPQSTENSVTNNNIGQLLFELELVLTEISNSSDEQKNQYIYQFTNDQLLYKVKTIKKQLSTNTII